MKKILVVVDMQNDFIDGVLGTQEAQSIIPNVVAKIKSYIQQGYPVYFTKDIHEEDYLTTQEGKNLPVEHCIRGTLGSKFNKEILKFVKSIQQNTLQAIIFEKNGFGSEQLPQYIKNTLIENEEVEIEVVGVCTDICVITNSLVLKTFLPEAKIVVDSSCCAGVTIAKHNNALEAMKSCQIEIV
ncbi:amidase [Candidatus Epulonipiscium fishelsonii]|uniref:Amidase n=1 Tax=Candidatus Epulonipiscium fishelsonii TaxID=77094 RepID=A0ACC8X9Q5_9FIRM|nr:amidase [Epulopiscium sp. SCG-B11WGA-EpuloA1]ONI43773.1 amidase [Epulopiscium sp. SCG-B05WGA-EpuloA1]